MAKVPRTLVFCAALAGASAPASSIARAQNAPSSERPQYVQVIARDYIFEAPSALREGLVTFHLTNQGSDVHQLSIVEVGAGHTIKQFFDAMRVAGTPPAWAVTVGMTPTIQPDNEAFVTLRLVPGHYVFACMIPAKDGRSHVEKGMYQWVTVSAKAPSAKRPAKQKP